MITFRTLATVAAAAVACASQALMSFTGPTSLATGVRPSGVAAGDFDGDGDRDLAVATDTPDKISIFFNNGNGTFGLPVDYLTGAGTGPDALVATDLDGDLDLDLAFTLHNANQVRTLMNGGNGTFVLGASTNVGANPIDIVAANFGGNAAMDLATVNRDGNSASVMTAGALGYSTATVATEVEPRQLVAGDFDADGDNDIFVTNHDSRSISFLRNTGGTFALFQSYTVGADVRPEGIAAGDLDNDGDLDLAVATSDTGVSFLAIFRNSGAGAFTGPVNFVTGGLNSDSVVLGDFDFDGDLDAIVTNQDSNNISLMHNAGNATFGAATLLAAGTRPGWIIAADLDNDGDLEIVVANRDSNNLSLYLNTIPPAGFPVHTFAVGPGSVVSGNLASLQSSDDTKLVLRPGAVLVSSQEPLALILEGTAASATATTLSFSVESSASIANLNRRISLFNFTTNAWVQFDERAATLTDSVTQVNVTTLASNYIHPTSRLVRARVSWKSTGAVLVYPWSASVDTARWQITP